MTTSTNTLTAEVVQITPEMAKRLLEDTERPRNRTIRPRDVDRLVTAMESDRFYGLNGETISLTAPLDQGGQLTDGQHRLRAIEITGKPQTMLAVYGVQAESLKTIGQGRKRSVQDYLTIHGITDAGNVAAAVGQMVVWEKFHTFEPKKADYYASPEEAMGWIEAHPRILDAVKHAHTIRDWGLPVSTLSVLYYLFSEQSQSDADDFFTKLRSGIGLEEGDAILTLRERLHAITAERKRVPRDEFAGMVIKCWNAYRGGHKLRKLSFRVGGARPDKMPEIA